MRALVASRPVATPGCGRARRRTGASARRHRDSGGPRGARLSRDRADHDGLRRPGFHVQAIEIGRRRPRPEALRALRAHQDLRRRLGDQHAAALRGAARLRERVSPDPRPALPADGAGWPFPASPRSVRSGWMAAGLLTTISGFLLPQLGPSWLGLYEPWLRIGIVGSGLVFIAWGWVMPRKTWAGVQILAKVRGFQEFLERAEKDRLERMPADTLHR